MGFLAGGNKKPLDGVFHQNGSLPVVTPVTSPLNLANGDILPPSPRKARTGGACDRRVVDRKSALGPNGSTNFTPFSSSTPQSGDFRVVLENGESSSLDHQELMKQAENGAFVGVNRVEQTESLGKRDGKIISDRTALHAPLGGLIRSCVELNGSRSVHKPTQVKHPNHIRSQNGVGPCHHHQMQEQELEQKRLVTLLDFRIAMELNCEQLGDDWPVLLEKICCTHDFEE
ncbi:hypothetical protein L1987_08164 [Smallanthus sonchifolius]|uniref:Uncharacterized protein n=1 Tax=Smallanthus sonchifolius TaxID=185202 RepID=A0ACB9JLL2_9ASTR|nr:hypothetical protein L1987_08164 [Smallanthus sonchifolius]